MCSSIQIIRLAKYRFYRQFITTRHIRFSSNTHNSGDKVGDASKSEGEDGNKACQPTDCCSSPCDNNPSTPTLYECRKYGHCLPSYDMCPPFDSLPNIPTGIFRCTAGERLGAGACKSGCYKCPEYFSYQHMTFYDMHMIMRCCREPSPKTGRKP